MEEIYRSYPHNPPHLFRPNAIYMITGAILGKRLLLNSNDRKKFFCQTLFGYVQHYGWELEAWAVLSNHYHLIARAPENATNLSRLIQALHSKTAILCNALDGTPGRQVWYNYWDTCIDYERSYLARLHYVHTNPVRHGLVQDAQEYPFCSYRWFVERADANFRGQVFAQPIDRVRVRDNF